MRLHPVFSVRLLWVFRLPYVPFLVCTPPITAVGQAMPNLSCVGLLLPLTMGAWMLEPFYEANVRVLGVPTS